MVGYKTADQEDATHVIFEKDEYDKKNLENFNMRNRINALERQLATEKQEYAEDLSREAARCKQRLQKMQEKLDQMTEEAAEQKRLQEGLKRICRERANAERGIRPKKKCMGYVEQRSRKRDKLWRTSIQTPYKTSLEADLVIKEITKDIQHSFKKEFWNEFRIADIWEDLKADFWMVEIETEFEWKAGWMK